MVDTPSSIDDSADVSGSGSAPESSGIDIAAIMRSFGKVSAAADQSMADLTATTQRLNQAGATEQAGIMAAATAQSEINLIEASAQEKRNADNFAAAAFFGVNPHAPSFVLAQKATELRNEQADLDQRDKAIQGKMDQSFFEDPLSWLSAQVTLPADVASYNNVLHAKQQHEEALSMLTQHTLEAEKVNNIVDATDAAAKANAMNKLEFANASVKVSESQQKLATLGINVINMKQKFSDDQFNGLIKVNEALNANMRLEQAKLEYSLTTQRMGLEKQRFDLDLQKWDFEQNLRTNEFNLSKENFGLAKDRFDLEMRKFDEIEKPNAELNKLYKEQLMDQRTENMESDKFWQARLDKATSMLGMPPMPVREFKTMKGSYKDALESYMLSNYDGLGFNAAAALENANVLNAPLSPGQIMFRDKLNGFKNGAVLEYNKVNPGQDFYKLKPGEQNMAVNEYIRKRVSTEELNVPEVGGVYSPPPLAVTLDLGQVRDLSLTKDLAAIGNSNPVYPTRAQDIIAAAQAKIERGESTPEQMASEISTIYKSVNLFNTTQSQYAKFKVDAPTKFFTTVYPNSGMLYNVNKSVDMTNEASLQTYLTRNAIDKFVMDNMYKDTDPNIKAKR